MSIKGVIYTILSIAVLLWGCQQSISTVGVIEIDADKPLLHEGKLPIGLTLGGRSQSGKDLLSPNVLVNSSFDLAPRLENCKHDLSQGTVTTPNGYTAFYPLPEALYGWRTVSGYLSVQGGGATGDKADLCIALQPARDSLKRAEVVSTIFFSGREGGDYTFNAHAKRSSDSVTISVLLVDTALIPRSKPQVLMPTHIWSKVSAKIDLPENSDDVALMIRVEGKGVAHIDDVSFVPFKTGSPKYALSTELVELIDRFGAGFLRFPDGATANGFFIGTYPEWIDRINGEAIASRRKSIWTLNQQEYTGAFGVTEFLSLAKVLQKPPILLSNIGITDRGTYARAENIKLLEDRSVSHVALAEYMLKVYDISKDSLHLTPAIQLGYDMTSYDYFRRFKVMSSEFARAETPVDLISSGNLMQYQKYSNHVFDASGRLVSTPELSDLIVDIDDDNAMMRQPLMLGECYFNKVDSHVFVPSLVLRAAFLISAENHSAALRGLTLAPLLAEAKDRSVYPLIRVDGGRYRATPLYEMMQAFIQMRGGRLRVLNNVSSKDLTGWAPLYTSLTSSSDNKVFYLKAVNTTRHPLPYQILFKGKEFHPYRVRTQHFISEGKTTTVNLEDLDQYYSISEEHSLDTSDHTWTYVFKPYEVVFFEFVSR